MKPATQTLLKSTFLATCLLGAAASASASTLTYDFSTGGTAANEQAKGGSSTTLGTNYVESSPITGLNIDDILSASGTWKNNANNGDGGSILYFGIFSGPLSPSSSPLASVALTCSATLKASCPTTTNISFTAVTNGLNYYLAYFSNASNGGNGFKTGDGGTLTDLTPPPPPPSDVPLPATAALLGLGLLGLGAARRKQASAG